MELSLQFGFGMMEHCRFLIEQWGSGTVVLSPRDLSAEQLVRLAHAVRDRGGAVLLDPQLFQSSATHQRLIAHDFWPHDGEELQGNELRRCLSELMRLNSELGAPRTILPGSLARPIDDDWLQSQLLVIEAAQSLGAGRIDLVATAAVGSDTLRNDEHVQKLIEGMDAWDVAAVYLVCEHPAGDYLVTDPGWMANFLDIVAGIRLSGKECIVGYANHQMLIAGAAGANAICSGTWMNVRTFALDRFEANDKEEVRQRATWYYAPHLLSEFKITFLDIAQKNGGLGALETPAAYGSNYSDQLFLAPQPTLATFTGQDAFRHYLAALRTQCSIATAESFDATADAMDLELEFAHRELAALHRLGIRGQQRDFFDSVDANRGALAFLRQNRGPVLRRHWNSISGR